MSQFDFSTGKSSGFSEEEVESCVMDAETEVWISSLISKSMNEIKFSFVDFMGKEDSIVTLNDLVEYFFYNAFKIGYRESRESEYFSNFSRRPKVYEGLTKKVENYTTAHGFSKLTSAKKLIRIGIETRGRQGMIPTETLGVFVGVPDISDLYEEKSSKNLVRKLHDLGSYPENDPRYYIHTIYRYYIGELHTHHSSRDEVLRYPSIQKIFDLKFPVSSIHNIPSEFRKFLSESGGLKVPVVTLPVPSKTRPNSVVYGYDFESVPWVPFMRRRIHDAFGEWRYHDSKEFENFYPEFLVKGDPGNSGITKTIAKSIEMTEVISVMDGLDEEDCDFARRSLEIRPEISGVFRSYENHVFRTPDEQLRERLGFFLRSPIRKMFAEVTKNFPEFCNDVYSSLEISYETIDVFMEYCSAKGSMIFSKRDVDLWRVFMVDIRRVCSVLNAFSRKQDISDFLDKYGSVEGFLRETIVIA